MNNSDVSNLFDELGDLLEFQGANPFRVRAYRNAARTLKDLGEPLTAIVADPARKLTDIQGIGDDLADKIVAILTTGKLPQLEELRVQTPASVMALLRIPGLGPKKAAVLFKELGIQTLDQLREACQDHRVQALKGFGKKTEETILAGLPLASQAEVRLYWADADVVAQSILAHLRSCPSVEQLEIAGSYRRGR
ncbi:MAG: helix-hairpin-helix domain-containing protein, partial [Pirellulales bacterium]